MADAAEAVADAVAMVAEEAAAAAAGKAAPEEGMVPLDKLSPTFQELMRTARAQIDRAAEARDFDDLLWLARNTADTLERYGRHYQQTVEELAAQTEAHAEDKERVRTLATGWKAAIDDNDALKEELRGVAKFRKLSDARRRPLD